jgi:hypothetical protein
MINNWMAHGNPADEYAQRTCQKCNEIIYEGELCDECYEKREEEYREKVLDQQFRWGERV